MAHEPKQISFDFARSPGSASSRPTVRSRRRRNRSDAARTARKPVPQANLPLTGPIDETMLNRLTRRIQAHVPAKVELVATDNRCTLLSVRRSGDSYKVRIHHMFLTADANVVRALAAYIVGRDAAASAVLDRYIDDHQDRIKTKPARSTPKPTLNTKGKVWDLQELFDRLNLVYFGGALELGITWGRPNKKRPKRHHSIKMGSYSVEDQLIRIHPALDRPFVPRYFIETVIYHEMLHHVHPIPIKDGRRQFHTPEFRAHERAFPYYPHAKTWERANIDRLLYF
ncbi:MAG: hypothetical protein J7M25_02965 [Deltaproteobacteria bacterium]|nr:hypothetical protein [Deltaproteobacteria bacterium]